MTNNKSMTERGLFWVQGREQKKLWGTLNIGNANEMGLETFGSLIDFDVGGYHTILGQIASGQEMVTLIDCFASNWDLTSLLIHEEATDWSFQSYVVNGVVKGLAFEVGEEVAFERAVLDISTLAKWARPSLVKINPRGTDERVRVEDRADLVAEADLKEGGIRVVLRFIPNETWSQGMTMSRYSVEDHCFLIIQRTGGTKVLLKDLLSTEEAIRDLLAICCNEVPVVRSFSARHEKGDQSSATVFVRRRGSKNGKEEPPAFPALTLRDIGGIQGLGRWLEVREKYKVATARLVSEWYTETSYQEDRFHRMFVAVEGLLAVKENRDRAQISKADLARFVEEAIPDFQEITGRVPEDWASETKKVRDETISHLDPTSVVSPDGINLHIMSNVLYVAGAAFLLRETGLDISKVKQYVQKCKQKVMTLDKRQIPA